MRLHPDASVCDECDYWLPEVDAFKCQSPQVQKKREWAREYADLELVTTPDLLEFAPGAVYFPFFAPEIPPPPPERQTRSSIDGVFKIVHATNHPGIEGTSGIEDAVNALTERGYAIEFCFLQGVSHERVLSELADADLSIGKMKMGYYANAQIESMMLGVPTITSVRPDFVTPELVESGLILTDLDHLEETLQHLLDNPAELEEKCRIARSSIERLHDNDELADRLIAMYRSLVSGEGA
jgi:hypothetical protein